MANPVLVEVLRGDLVESRHEGSVAVFDAAGKPVLAIGDVEQPVFPRSAVKAIQALPLVESGAADHYGFGDRELALACASHSGEPEHVALATGMLAKAVAGRQRARMRRALAVEPGSDRRAGALGEDAVGTAQQLLGKALRLPVRLPASAHQSSRLCRRRSSLPGDGAPGDGRGHRRRAWRAQSRHRRLLDPDLRRAAQKSGDGLCQDGDRQRPFGRSRERGEAAVRCLHGRAVLRRRNGPLRYRADEGSALAASSSRAARKASIAQPCRSLASASR